MFMRIPRPLSHEQLFSSIFLEHYNQQNKLKDVESCLMHLDVTNLDIHQVRTHDMSTANCIQIESSPLFSSEVTFAKTSPLSSDGETLLGSRPVWCHFLCVQQRHARLHYSTGGILGIVGRSLFIAWGLWNDWFPPTPVPFENQVISFPPAPLPEKKN